MKLTCPDLDAMDALAGCMVRALERLLQSEPGSRPDLLVTFEGELGAGKTTLIRGLIRALGYAGRVKSPTYGLLETYHLAVGTAVHMDLYRLAEPEELEFLGIRDLLDQQPLLLVEWPRRGAGVLPDPDLAVQLEYAAAGGREVELLAGSPRGGNWLNFCIDFYQKQGVNGFFQ